MTFTDWTGSVGVALLLIAFLLNLTNKITQDSIPYRVLNLVGAAVACYASVLLRYWPFIILEAIWMAVSMVSLGVILRKRISQMKSLGLPGPKPDGGRD